MGIVRALKRALYFRVAAYFGFWASIRLGRWKPRTVAVIGSSGKTTLLHLIEAQLGGKARYSHHANSAFGVPFHILGLERKSFRAGEWIALFARAPFAAFRAAPRERVYVVEADAERPGEGRFLADLLAPEIVVWLSLEEAHGAQYDRLARRATGHEPSADARDAVKREMAREFGSFLERVRALAILDRDNPYIKAEADRCKTAIDWVSMDDVLEFAVSSEGVSVRTAKATRTVPALLPPLAALSVVAAADVAMRLGFEAKPSFDGFELPPGRSGVLQGKRGITIIDSTYNATIGGMKTMLDLFERYPAAGEKWLVLGDMIEQGESERAEHEDLARLVADLSPDRVVLVGPRLMRHALPILKKALGEKVAAFEMPADALSYLSRETKGGETILFKGARFLEGVVERLLADPKDASRLPRREPVWARRRKAWGI